jgi:hypothetical protein
MGGFPPAVGMHNDTVERIVAAEKAGQPAPGRPDPSQLEWIEACNGRRGNLATGMSSKTHCDFDYAGSMIEQMLPGLAAHRAGKKLEYSGWTPSRRRPPSSDSKIAGEESCRWLQMRLVFSIQVLQPIQARNTVKLAGGTSWAPPLPWHLPPPSATLGWPGRMFSTS